MPIIPYSGMVDNALKLKSDNTLWLAIGRTTPWPNELSPPAESVNAQQVEEVVGYKKIELTSVVVPDALGEIIFQGQNYKLVPDNQAISQIARWCYMKGSINYAELPVVTFRQVGIFSGLIPASGYESNLVLLPQHVLDRGRLIFLANFTSRTRSDQMRDIIEVVREFAA